MNPSVGCELKYLLLLLPRHKSYIKVGTVKPKITHESNSRVGLINPASFATTTYIARKLSKRYKLNIMIEP